MEKLINFLEMKTAPVAGKISSQRHMTAIRKGIIATLPLSIVGSFFTIFSNFPIPSVAEYLSQFQAMIDIPSRFTIGILALYATFGISYSLAKSYNLDGLTCGMLGTLSFLITVVSPFRLLTDIQGADLQGVGYASVVAAGRYMSVASLSSSSLFSSIVTGIVAVEIFRFMKEKKITIKMPAGVPPEVSNSFVALFPTAVVILLFWTIRYIFKFEINVFLSNLLMPFKNILAGNSLFGGLLTVLLITFFWVLGIHGPAIMGPVIRPFWDMSIAENVEAFADGASAFDLPNIFTEQFLQWFVWIGGAGGTLALVVLFLFSKSEYLRSLGKLSLLPGIFNINEPVIFGAPIVMNPILGIPFIVAPLVTTSVSYVFTLLGLVPKMATRLPMTIPAPIAAWMSTDWHIMSGVLVIINFIITAAIYYPFFKVFEANQLQREAEETAEA